MMNFKVIYLFLSRLWMMPTPMYQWPLMVICIEFDPALLDRIIGALKWSSNANEVKNIYVSTHFVDMRKSIDGLTLIVHSQFQMNVLDHSLFIFTNRSRNRIKILYYESNGFWLFIKRLEHGKFKIQDQLTRASLPVSLSWLLEGLEYDEKLKEKQLLI